jgi:hypothetical protein
MAIVVLHTKDKKKYVLVGTGYGAYKASRPSVLGGSLFPHEDMGEIPVAAVSDSKGKIHWFLTEDLQVLEVDGQILAEIIKEEDKETKESNDGSLETEYCPACNSMVSIHDKQCPSCELTLQYEEY